jgi:hydrogenase expression/formation protein HypE
MSDQSMLPLGKLAPDLLAQLLEHAPLSDPRILLGPGIGLDCAVIDVGTSLLVFKSDPITFATDEIGWYCVQICANDIATMGARPRWMLTTLMMPESNTTEDTVQKITEQIHRACQSLNISLIGGHTEITHGIDRPILVGTLIGEVSHSELVTQKGARAGNAVLLTKGVPIEATAIIAREFPQLLKEILTPDELRKAVDFLYIPGISITRDAEIARRAGRVTAMHDPTEGGLAAALWELSIASQVSMLIDPSQILIPPLAGRICDHFGLDPLATIASGALLLTCAAEDAETICRALTGEGIECAIIGEVTSEGKGVFQQINGERMLLPRPQRDEIARFFEEH